MVGHITHDAAYNTVHRDDFSTMLDVERYVDRSKAFDEIIAATHDHFWDPLDKAYINFDLPFDQTGEWIMPKDQIVELNSAVADRLNEGQQLKLANEVVRWNISSILHGEQGALSLSASLCHLLRDPGAQEYAANQTREEARHVTGFSLYVQKRWGTPLPVGECLGGLLEELVLAPEVYKKLVGMQMLIEGLAMGAFASIHRYTNDKVLKRLTQLVMTDEAFHHKFGKIWADKTVPKLTLKEHDIVEDWAAQCFETLLFNLTNVRQRYYIYEKFGLDWEWVRDATREVFGEDERRNSLKDETSIFRVLVKTLLQAGIITQRTIDIYSAWVDVKELKNEGNYMIGDVIAAEGIEYLREINQKRQVIGQKSTL